MSIPRDTQPAIEDIDGWWEPELPEGVRVIDDEEFATYPVHDAPQPPKPEDQNELEYQLEQERALGHAAFSVQLPDDD